MRNSLTLSRHMNVDRNVRDISHGVSMLATKLSHDEELESAGLKLWRLEGELKVRKKQYAKVRTVAPGTHSQVGAYEARVKALGKEITS